MTEAQGPPRGSAAERLAVPADECHDLCEPVLLHEGQMLGETLVAAETIFGAAHRPIEDHAQHALRMGDGERQTGEQPMQPPMRWALSIPRWSSNPLPCAT